MPVARGLPGGVRQLLLHRRGPVLRACVLLGLLAGVALLVRRPGGPPPTHTRAAPSGVPLAGPDVAAAAVDEARWEEGCPRPSPPGRGVGRRGGAGAEVVIGVMTTAPMHEERLSPLAAAWGNASAVPVLLVTDGDAAGARRLFEHVLVADCPSDHGAGLCCKTGAFFAAAAARFPSARWFLRVTDDTVVDTPALVALVATLGASDTPRTLGNRLLRGGVPEVPFVWFDPTGVAAEYEFPGGSAWLASRGAVDDPRFVRGWADACASTPQHLDDVAWGRLTTALAWPRLEPSLAFSHFEASVERCKPWFMCAAAAAGLDEAAGVPDARAVAVPLTYTPVSFHMYAGGGGMARVLAITGRCGPLRFVREPVRVEPPAATWYRDMFTVNRELCVAAQAEESRRAQRDVAFHCETMS